MDKVYKSVFATSDEDLSHDRFSDEALQAMTEQAAGKSILFQFNPHRVVGKVVSADKDGKSANVTVEINNYYELLELLEYFPYIVPAFSIEKMHAEGGVRVFDKVKLLYLSLTDMPVDTHITKLEEDKE